VLVAACRPAAPVVPSRRRQFGPARPTAGRARRLASLVGLALPGGAGPGGRRRACCWRSCAVSCPANALPAPVFGRAWRSVPAALRLPLLRAARRSLPHAVAAAIWRLGRAVSGAPPCCRCRPAWEPSGRCRGRGGLHIYPPPGRTCPAVASLSSALRPAAERRAATWLLLVRAAWCHSCRLSSLARVRACAGLAVRVAPLALALERCRPAPGLPPKRCAAASLRLPAWGRFCRLARAARRPRRLVPCPAPGSTLARAAGQPAAAARPGVRRAGPAHAFAPFPGAMAMRCAPVRASVACPALRSHRVVSGAASRAPRVAGARLLPGGRATLSVPGPERRLRCGRRFFVHRRCSYRFVLASRASWRRRSRRPAGRPPASASSARAGRPSRALAARWRGLGDCPPPRGHAPGVAAGTLGVSSRLRSFRPWLAARPRGARARGNFVPAPPAVATLLRAAPRTTAWPRLPRAFTRRLPMSAPLRPSAARPAGGLVTAPTCPLCAGVPAFARRGPRRSTRFSLVGSAGRWRLRRWGHGRASRRPGGAPPAPTLTSTTVGPAGVARGAGARWPPCAPRGPGLAHCALWAAPARRVPAFWHCGWSAPARGAPSPPALIPGRARRGFLAVLSPVALPATRPLAARRRRPGVALDLSRPGRGSRPAGRTADPAGGWRAVPAPRHCSWSGPLPSAYPAHVSLPCACLAPYRLSRRRASCAPPAGELPGCLPRPVPARRGVGRPLPAPVSPLWRASAGRPVVLALAASRPALPLCACLCWVAGLPLRDRLVVSRLGVGGACLLRRCLRPHPRGHSARLSRCAAPATPGAAAAGRGSPLCAGAAARRVIARGVRCVLVGAAAAHALACVRRVAVLPRPRAVGSCPAGSGAPGWPAPLGARLLLFPYSAPHWPPDRPRPPCSHRTG